MSARSNVSWLFSYAGRPLCVVIFKGEQAQQQRHNNERKEICRSPEPFNESLLLKKLRDFYLMRNNNITPSTPNDYWTTAYATWSASQERHHFLCLNTTTTTAAATAENVFFLGPCYPVRSTNAERKLRRKMKKKNTTPKKRSRYNTTKVAIYPKSPVPAHPIPAPRMIVLFIYTYKRQDNKESHQPGCWAYILYL